MVRDVHTSAFMTSPLLIVCGSPGLGKSFEAFKAFQDSFAIISSKNNVHYFEKLLKGRLKDGPYKPPKKIRLIDAWSVATTSEPYASTDTLVVKSTRNADNVVVKVDTKSRLEGSIQAVVDSTVEAVDKDLPLPYRNLIIDEWGAFMDRVFAQFDEMEYKTAKGGDDMYGPFKAMTSWVNERVEQFQLLTSKGVGVCLVMHDREPDSAKHKKGGPKGPSAGIADKLCAQAHGVIQRVMKDPTLGEKGPDGKPAKAKRLWVATAGEHWNRKLQGLEPEDEDRIGTMELSEILAISGYAV